MAQSFNCGSPWAAVAVLLALTLAVQAAKLQPPPGIYVAGPPSECSADLIKSISWGAATSAYQIEGAYNEGGKGVSIWDTFVTIPGKIKGGGTGNVAIDHAHRYKEDFQMMKDMGINMHRFSIAWTRIVPQGRAGSPINMDGVNFYHNLIDEMIAQGITPVATMYHWDMPQALQDAYQGLQSEQFVTDFNYYATALFNHFGDKIKHWVTINEPPSICDHGYNNGRYAPGVQGGKQAMFRCGHVLLLAHATVAKTYREAFQPEQQGKIGITTNVVWPVPLSDKAEDKRAAQNKLDRDFGWLMDPLYFGDYPATSKVALKDDLPSFTPEQQALVKGSTDFIGVNVYTARWVYANPDNPIGFKETSYGKDGKRIGEKGGADWLLSVPSSLGGILSYVGQRYGKPETWVTEFGTGITGENMWQGAQVLKDSYRTSFFSTYLNNACKVIKENNLSVPMIFAWTMFDNFEWNEGYDIRYGLVHVDFSTLKRTIKESGYWWSEHFFKHSKRPT